MPSPIVTYRFTPATPHAAASRQDSLSRPFRLVTAAVLATTLLAILSYAGMEMSIAMPLSILLGLTGQHFVALTLQIYNFDLLTPTTLMAAYFTIYFGLRTIYIWAAPGSMSQMGNNSYDDYLGPALWAACIGYVAFALGTSSAFAKRTTRAAKCLDPIWRSVPKARIMAMMLIGVASLAYLFAHGQAVGNYTNRDFLRTPPNGFAILLERLINVSWIFVCVSLVLPQRQAKGDWPLALSSIALLGLQTAISGSKESLIEPLLNTLIVYHYLKQRLRLWQALAVAVPVIMLAFGILNFYRFVVVGEMGTPKSLGDVGSRLSSTSDYLRSGSGVSSQRSAFEQLMIRNAGVDALALVMKYTPDPNPFAYGREIVQWPLAFIPRQIWEGKPAQRAGMDFEHNYMGMPMAYLGFSSIHLIADLYRNFYLFGIAGGMFLIGAGVQTFYYFCAPFYRNVKGVLFYAALLPALFHCLEVDIAGALINATKACFLIFAAAAFLGIRFWRSSSLCLKPFPNGHVSA